MKFNECAVFLRNAKERFVYVNIIKPLLFKIDAEKVHNKFIVIGKFLGSNWIMRNIVKSMFYYKNSKLKQQLLGIVFENPVGLAAGFDYEGKLTQILPEVGFGFYTVGSVTFDSYGGNKFPRILRLPKSLSLLVNKGLKSPGAKSVILSLKNLKFKIPLGISIAKTNCKLNSDENNEINDYIKSLKLWEQNNIGSYYEINISCPNSFGGEVFTTPKKLEKLLKEIDKLKTKKPVFLKMPVDLTEKQTAALLKIAEKHYVQGLIFGNLTKNRENYLFDNEEIIKAPKGNFSGMPTQEISNKLIKFSYKRYKNRFIIIGCGGIFNAEDAYKKIKYGASLIQVITGMIFQGPQVISQINQELVKLLEKDGYKNISEAIGKNNQ